MLRSHVGAATQLGADEAEKEQAESILKQIASLSTFGRLIDPTEIADTLLFAATNPVINGAVLHANLGQVGS